LTERSFSVASQALDRWIESEGFQGWDPYDALNSPILRGLTFGQRRIGQVWVQLFKRSPLNLRRWMGVPKLHNAKGMGLFLASYWRKYQLSGDERLLEQVRWIADWLLEQANQARDGRAWGYPFPWPNRGFFAPAGTPNVINTVFVGLAFVDLCRGPDPGWSFDPAAIARAAAEFVLKGLNRIDTGADEFCFSYTALDRRAIHNANLMAAWLLAEVSTLAGDSLLDEGTSLTETALAAARFTARRQAEDGSWPYGTGPVDGWIDNFHTGFVLQAYAGIRRALDSNEFADVEARGYAYWKKTFFLTDGTPKYYAHKTYPIDVHAAAQGVLTRLACREHDAEALSGSRQQLAWAIKHLQDPQGYFYFQRQRFYTIRIPYMRWSQAWMQRAFSELARVEANEDLD
jgi:hypothetical protein